MKDVEKREDILLRIFNKSKVNSEKRLRIIHLLNEMRDRFHYKRKITVVRSENLTGDIISQNGRFTKD